MEIQTTGTLSNVNTTHKLQLPMTDLTLISLRLYNKKNEEKKLMRSKMLVNQINVPNLFLTRQFFSFTLNH